MNLFRLVWYDTKYENKYEADKIHQFMGDFDSIFRLWFVLTAERSCKHVEVYNLNGVRQHPERGSSGMTAHSA